MQRADGGALSLWQEMQSHVLTHVLDPAKSTTGEVPSGAALFMSEVNRRCAAVGDAGGGEAGPAMGAWGGVGGGERCG